MKPSTRWIPVLTSLLLLCTIQAWAIDRSGFEELVQLMDSARLVEADIFAPKTWQKATEAFAKAEKDIDESKKQKNLDKHVAEAREYTENAMKAAEVGKLSLKEYLDPREKARQAKAPSLVPLLYAEAEEQFVKATQKVESGDVKGALKEAAKSSPMFDSVELEAIRAEILGAADRLIQKALADDAAKYALSTLDKARTARKKADAILVADRYERTESIAEATRAEYEARHASNIGLSVRSLKRNDQAWEKLMLIYEIQMNRVGEAFGKEYLPFDEGPLAAADTLLASIHDLQARNAALEGKLGSTADQLQSALARLDESATATDALVLASTVDQCIAALLAEKGDLAEQVQSRQVELAQLTEQHEEVAGALAVRQEREQKFRSAKAMVTPAEGDVLFNAANDIVLRLHGLAFGIGKSDVTEEQMPLLEKVQQIVQMFPDARLAVEGHTDASGDPKANLQLSEKRAYAVMQYLRQTLLIPAGKVQAIGYGADRPVASNQTADGRAKNRRIDIIIMQ